MKIIKKSGDIVDFNRNKLRRSLERSGASDSDVENIMHTVESQLHEGMRTGPLQKGLYDQSQIRN